RGGHKQIWVLSLASRQLHQLTFSEFEDDYPSWSADGKLIAFTGGPWKRRDFFAVSAAGGPARRLTRASGFYGACAFFPDGQSLVYHAYDGGCGQLFTLYLPDGTVKQLTSGTAWDYKPTVSP